ncbi:MAG: hypothetical protein WCI39_12880 [Gallionellaceae bacterium]
MNYTASKSQSQNRPGFSISFRHPLRKDSKGKIGLKVRRGLKTSDPTDADRLVGQMNTLLSDESWWNASRRLEAESKFDSIIVAAFYDDIQAGIPDSWSLRESHISLPTKEDGYSRVLFVGTTGAGKTSLLRHFIGSNPDEDRFPSTSTAKTTVSDIEVIPADGTYKAVVTFFSEHLILANVEDCVLNACTAIWEKQPLERVADRLLNHQDQRFRLGYILGSWRKDIEHIINEDEWSFGASEEPTITNNDAHNEALSNEESTQNSLIIGEYINRIIKLSKSMIVEVSSLLSEDLHKLSSEDKEAALEIFQEQILETSDFHDLVQDILDDILRRFDYLEEEGKEGLKRRSSGWPEYWTYEVTNRNDFIRQVRWFSSNYAPSFGRLLTPLVDGIRVMGPLFPDFSNRKPKLVLLDGQGLGHTPDSSSSVTTHITRRFSEVDVILLVDNAEQPVQAAAQSVLRAVASSGHYAKLAMGFTHFDQVKGLNLPTFADKRAHIMASVHNYLHKLRDVLNSPVVNAMEKVLENQCFMLGGLNYSSRKLPLGVKNELERLANFFERAIETTPLPKACPVYDPTGLTFAVQNAANKFQEPWSARLGLGQHSNIHKEHWTRIKALTRKVAGELGIEYDTLRPVADLLARMSEEISKFLDSPLKWTNEPSNEEEAQESISVIRRSVFAALHDLVLHRLIDELLSNWRKSFNLSGKGSTYIRAKEIQTIFELAAPIPGTVNTEQSIAFLRETRRIVKEAIEASGGELSIDNLA